VTAGVVRWAEGFYCFDPETGTEITKIPTDLKATRQIFFNADGVFRLGTGPSPTLTVYEPGTWKELWSVKDLQGVWEMAAPYAHGRLVCKADDTLFVIDTKQKKVVAKITPPKFDPSYCPIRQTEHAVVVLCRGKKKNTLACFAVPGGKLLWSRETNSAHEDAIAVREKLVVSTQPDPATKKGLPATLVAVSVDEGKESWRWQVPQLANKFYDYAEVHLEACASGFIVTRTWIVLD
jgi:outer membrane protein assembly factor BamB